MNEILQNLANIHLLNFCKENKIDCSGTYTVKNGRGFKYNMVQEKSGETVATVIFHKNATATYSINPNNN